MNWWQSILLGIVEGLTEYLPVSSTGHLIVTQRLLGIPETPASNAFAICIQAGAIVAVLGIYFPQVKNMLAGLLGRIGVGEGDPDGLRLFTNIIVAFMPAVVIGLAFNDWIEDKLFGMWPIVSAWFVGGIAILVVSKWRKKNEVQAKLGTLRDLTWKAALAIGFIQCIAMWPGTSRSLVTIVGGILMGLSVAAAVEFSFLLGVITLLAATAYESLDSGAVMIEAYSWSTILIGSAAACVSAVIAVRWMISYLTKHDMSIFGYYRVALAIGIAGMIVSGKLPS